MGQQYDLRQRNAGFITFFISGICAISSGVVVSLLQEQAGFDYGTTGTLLALMNIGNLLAGFAAGALPGKLGMKRTVMLLTAGYAVGYGLMSATLWVPALMAAFFLAGVGKGSTINTCTILVGDNCENRTKGMNLMHSCYAFGALLCPFLIAAAAGVSGRLPMASLGVLGACLWLVFTATPMAGSGKGARQKTDWSFLRSKKFWLLTGLIFCQNATETSVTGWMVTYFKGSGILSGVLSTYTVTVMWLATLIFRLLIAFVFPVKRAGRTMIFMSVGCTVFYFLMMLANTQVLAIVLLFAFAASMAGMNPTAVASAGRMSSVTSMGIMLPVASSGAILMPWIIGIVAEHLSIWAGMASVLLPSAGMLAFSMAVKRLEDQGQE
ncbi:MAG TPA: MFS transporter [Candidatus Ventrimonas merdavium]|nr:MFS transporter [Candidatus Ventrimonas merdavium]